MLKILTVISILSSFAWANSPELKAKCEAGDGRSCELFAIGLKGPEYDLYHEKGCNNGWAASCRALASKATGPEKVGFIKKACEHRDLMSCRNLIEQELGSGANPRAIAQAMCERHQDCDEVSKLNKKDPNAIYCTLPHTQYGPNGKQVLSGYGLTYWALSEQECKTRCDWKWGKELKELTPNHTLKARCRLGKQPNTRDIASYPN